MNFNKFNFIKAIQRQPVRIIATSPGSKPLPVLELPCMPNFYDALSAYAYAREIVYEDNHNYDNVVIYPDTRYTII